MKAMIFAAGLGTRLLPLTKDKPKALVEVNGISILEILIKKLIQFNFNEIIINVHHFATQIIDFVKSRNNFGIRIDFSNETEKLLDTGGGLKKAAWFFNDQQPFLVHNVDIISNIDLGELIEIHKNNGALATLCVKKRQSTRYFLFDKDNLLCGWKNTKTNKQILTNSNIINPVEMAFSGIQVINPKIFNLIEENGVFSIIDLYLRLSKNYKILGYCHDENILDLGKPENLKKANKHINFL